MCDLKIGVIFKYISLSREDKVFVLHFNSFPPLECCIEITFKLVLYFKDFKLIFSLYFRQHIQKDIQCLCVMHKKFYSILGPNVWNYDTLLFCVKIGLAILTLKKAGPFADGKGLEGWGLFLQLTSCATKLHIHKSEPGKIYSNNTKKCSVLQIEILLRDPKRIKCVQGSSVSTKMGENVYVGIFC